MAADPDALWQAYQQLAVTAGDLWRQWSLIRAVARTDGTAGQLYGRAYEAQEAADAAYRAYLAVAYPPAVRAG